MDQDTIQLRLADLSRKLESEQQKIEAAFEKISIALAGVFRLTQGEQTLLNGLHGSPQEVQGYVLNLVSETKQTIEKMNETTARELSSIIANLGMDFRETESSKR